MAWARTAVHRSKPVARRDVGEVACGQVAVGLKAVLDSKAVDHITVSTRLLVSFIAASLTSSLSQHHSPHSARRGKSRSQEGESPARQRQRLR